MKNKQKKFVPFRRELFFTPLLFICHVERSETSRRICTTIQCHSEQGACTAVLKWTAQAIQMSEESQVSHVCHSERYSLTRHSERSRRRSFGKGRRRFSSERRICESTQCLDIVRVHLPIFRKNVKISLLMKKLRPLILLITFAVILSFAFAAVPAYAEESSARNVNMYEGNGFTLSTLTLDGKPLGVRFYGLYFGSSDIAVSFDLYGDDGVKIDFFINEQENNLTEAQRQTRSEIIGLGNEINAFIRLIDSLANTQYDGSGELPLSDVYRYNTAKLGDTLEVNEHTYEMLQIAQEMYFATNGAFNPAVYRLVDLWGFSSRIYSNGNFGLPYDRKVTAEQFWSDGYPLPDDKYVRAFSDSAFTDFGDSAVTLSQSEGKYYVSKNVRPAVVDGIVFQQWIDLGGVAKGYTVDVINAMLSAAGFTRYSVDAGSSSQAYGTDYSGEQYVLGINDPFEFSLFPPSVVKLNVSNVTVSTSGQYIRKYVTDGVEYAHIVDGSLGKPANTGIKSVSVIAPEDNFWAGKGDCLTTALTVMGRDKAIDFMNGYLKENGVKVVVVYETVSGEKQLLTNYSKSDIVAGDTFDGYAWSVKTDENGNIIYDADAKAPINLSDSTVWIIVGCVFVALSVAVILIVHFVKGKGNAERNILNAKRDKPFKPGDVAVYLAVILVIVVLFSVFLGEDKTESVKLVKVVDFSKSGEGEVLFVYNVTRNEWQIYDDNSNGWNIQVSENGNELTVRLSREFDGQERFNVLTVTRGTSVSVKMTDSVCGHSQECVRNFPAVTVPNSAIVCSPNHLKIITE